MWQVCVDTDEAAGHVARGASVVLVVVAPDDADLHGLRRAGTGRVAIFVGDPADPTVQAAAAEMAAELGGRSEGA